MLTLWCNADEKSTEALLNMQKAKVVGVIDTQIIKKSEFLMQQFH